jgi:hypothetical protein
VARILGLNDDRPFPEEDDGWERAYWFEVSFVDLADKRWILEFSPRDNVQYVRRAWY